MDKEVEEAKEKLDEIKTLNISIHYKYAINRILNYIQELEEAQTTYEVNKIWKEKIENRIGELKQLLVDPQCAENVRYRIYELQELLNGEK